MTTPRILSVLFCFTTLTVQGADTWFDALIQQRESAAEQTSVQQKPAPLPDFGLGRFTVAAWFKTDRDGTILSRTTPKGKWVPGGKALFVRNGRLAMDVGWVGCLQGKSRVADGQWHHVTLTGGYPQSLYLDGKPEATARLEARRDPDGNVVKIGFTSANFPATSQFAGEIDDVQILGRVLSADDVAALYEACQACAEATPSAGALVHLTFDGNVKDTSRGNNHGTVQGKAEFSDGKQGQALKLSQDGHVRIDGSGAPREDAVLWRELEASFTDARSRQEMADEHADGIWGGDWKRVAYPEIAARYAAVVEYPTGAKEKAATLAEAAKSASALAPVRNLYLASKRYERLKDSLDTCSLDGIAEVIDQLHGEGKGEGKQLHLRLKELEAQFLSWGDGVPGADTVEKWQSNVDTLRRDAVKGLTRFGFDKIVFVKRLTYSANHYYTEFINSKWTPGGNLCVLDVPTGDVWELVPELKGGVFERFDVDWDADKVVFAWKGEDQQGYRIYEIEIDPDTGKRIGKLKQLTFPQADEAEIQRLYRARPHYHHGTDDMHPCYLPDGDIVFISTRCQYGILCDAPDDFTTTVLYRMKPDGSGMQKLSNSSVSEASPVILSDGRIMYTRWEYLDKGAVSVKCLWAMYPDGSSSAEVYANDISLPPTFIYGREIPDAKNKYVVMGTPHCPQNGVGTVIRLDMSKAIRTREPMTYITPYVDIRAEPGFAFRDSEKDDWRTDRSGKGPLFKDPYPLSEELFLVAHKPTGSEWKDPTHYDLYLLDETGRPYLVYEDKEISCWLPYPLKRRTRPPVLATTRDKKMAAKDLATCVVTDIYHGMEDVARGTIKHIRVLEQIPRPWATRRRWGGDCYDQQHACITKDTHLGLKVQHGVVPVEPDGSAHFVVPARGNIFFQALDENYMAVQTERTYVNYMPGETRSCIGCHETPHDAVKPSEDQSVVALSRPPSVPGPQPGETQGQRPLDYEADVQPVLDKHCVECHSGDKPKGGLNLSGERTHLFCTSYEQLIPERRRGPGRRGKYELVGPTIGENHPKTGNVHYLPARSLGSHASVLVGILAPGKTQIRDAAAAEIAAKLAKKHTHLNLSREELLRITNWVDTNAQYYGMYWGRKNLQHKDHPNFRPKPTFERAASMVSLIPEEER